MVWLVRGWSLEYVPLQSSTKRDDNIYGLGEDYGSLHYITTTIYKVQKGNFYNLWLACAFISYTTIIWYNLIV